MGFFLLEHTLLETFLPFLQLIQKQAQGTASPPPPSRKPRLRPPPSSLQTPDVPILPPRKVTKYSPEECEAPGEPRPAARPSPVSGALIQGEQKGSKRTGMGKSPELRRGLPAAPRAQPRAPSPTPSPTRRPGETATPADARAVRARRSRAPPPQALLSAQRGSEPTERRASSPPPPPPENR